MSDAIKDQIGNYELIELVGDGAQGKIFKARCVADSEGSVARNEQVAIKVLRVPPDDERAQQRFETQSAILRRISHPHIIHYLDSFTWHSGEWDEAQCLVMEYLEGETLANRLKTARRGLPWLEVKVIFEQCLSGLIHAGRQGIIHRDLKPSNIFLTGDGSTRVFDFDIARVEGDSQRSTVGWKGSFDYMAPDFITEAEFHGDEISDVFSLGTCIYQALTGKLPFESFRENAHIGYLNRWRSAQTPPVLSFRAGPFRVLANAKSFISRSLNPQRSQRFQSFAEMRADLQRIHYRMIQHMGKDTYELRDLLGRGGFGEVFKSVRQSDGQAVAIKHLFMEKQSTRFIKEARILQRYPHRFLVNYIDFIEVQGVARDNQYFLVLELLEGMPEALLRHRIKREGKLEPAEAIPLFMNYLEALDFLHGHSRSLIHRDIKPMNLYAPTGHPEQARIFDLGVARDVSGTVTSGGIPGTLDYMAPEFAFPGADRGTPQSDLYALGLCLYESLAGQTAFARLPPDINSAWPIFQARAQHMSAVDYQARVFRMYPDLKAVVQTALASNPNDRYVKAEVMRQALAGVLLRLDRPEDVPPVEAPTTLAASALLDPSQAGPMPLLHENPAVMNAGQSAVPESDRQVLEESAESALPDLPDVDMAGDADVIVADRWKRAIRAVGIIMLVVAAGVTAMLWWSRSGGGTRPLAGTAVAPVSQTSVTAVAVHPLQASDVPSVESAGVRAARKKMQQIVRSVRIPIADTGYISNLSSALVQVRRLGKQYPKFADEAEQKVREMEQHGRNLPALFQSGINMALAQKDARKAQDLLSAWQNSRPYAPLMGLTSAQVDAQAAAMAKILGRYQWNTSVTQIARLIPVGLSDDRDVERAELSAECMDAVMQRHWPGVSAVENKERIAALRSALATAVNAGIAAWRDEAVAQYQTGNDGSARHAALMALQDDAPTALALAQADIRTALTTVNAARSAWWRMMKKQQVLLTAIEAGAPDFDRNALTGVLVDPKRFLDVWAAAGRVRKGFNVLILLDSDELSRVYLAAVADCWKNALRCAGPLANAIRNSAWTAIHDPLVTQGAILLKPRDMAMAGLRTPEQQARLRREYLRLLARIEEVTGRVSVCREDDPLRAQAARYFQRPFLHPALLENSAYADKVPWLAEEFRQAQTQ